MPELIVDQKNMTDGPFAENPKHICIGAFFGDARPDRIHISQTATFILSSRRVESESTPRQDPPEGPETSSRFPYMRPRPNVVPFAQ